MNARTHDQWLLKQTWWLAPEAVALRAAMDEELGGRYSFRSEGLTEEGARERDAILHIEPASVVATLLVTDPGGHPVGHGAVRRLGTELEIKRVYVAPEARGRGASRALMRGLEAAAAHHGASRVILQTGDRQPEAVALYEGLEYTPIPIYPPYTPLTFSRCFEKRLAHDAGAWKNESVV